MRAHRLTVIDLKGGTTLLQNAHVSVRLFQSRRLVLFIRTGQAFQTAPEVDECTAAFARVVPHQTRTGLRILIDMRAAPVRVHPALDPAFARLRQETQIGFARVVVLVATALGRLRSERLAELAIGDVLVVGSLEEALEAL